MDALLQLVHHLPTQTSLDCIECHGRSVAEGAKEAANEQMDKDTIERRWQKLSEALAERGQKHSKPA